MLQNFDKFSKVNEKTNKMSNDEINQALLDMKTPNELKELFVDMWNNGNELQFMKIYNNCENDALAKVFFDAIKKKLERFSGGLL